MNLLNSDIEAFCNEQKSLYPTLQEQYNTIQHFCIDKLWYQLTVYLIEFIEKPENSINHNFVDLCVKLLSNIRKKIEKISYCTIICAACKQLYPDYSSALQFIKTYGDLQQHNVVESIEHIEYNGNKNNSLPLYKQLESGYLLIMIQAASIYIHFDNKKIAYNYLDTVNTLLQPLSSVNNSIYAFYYRTWIELFKTFGPYKNIYLNGLKYFSYINLNDLPEDVKMELSCDTILSAIVNDTAYSIGELLLNPIYSYVNNSENKYITELLSIIYNGNIEAWKDYQMQYSDTIQNNGIIRTNINIIEEKITNTSLIELAFHRTSNERIIKYIDICNACHVDMNNIENFIIHCMSLHLIDGYLDDVNKSLTVTSVQPRILDADHINNINNHIKNWIVNIDNIVNLLETKTKFNN